MQPRYQTFFVNPEPLRTCAKADFVFLKPDVALERSRMMNGRDERRPHQRDYTLPMLKWCSAAARTSPFNFVLVIRDIVNRTRLGSTNWSAI